MTEPLNPFPPNMLCTARPAGWAHQVSRNENVCDYCTQTVTLTPHNGYQVWTTREIVHEEEDLW